MATALIRGIFTVIAFVALWRTGPSATTRASRGLGAVLPPVGGTGDPDTYHGNGPLTGEIKKILLIRMDLLGDVILTMPAVAAIRRRYPDAHITMLALPYTAPVLGLFPYVDRVLSFDLNKLRPSGDMLNLAHYRDLWSLVRLLRQERYDLAISFYGLYAGILAFLSGARRRIGYRGEGGPFLFSLPIPGRRYEKRQHEVEYNLALARAAGARERAEPLQTQVPGAVMESADLLLEREGIAPRDLLVAIHPGSTNGAAKRWPAPSWAGLADRLEKELGARVIISGVASEGPLVREVTQRMRTRPVVLAGKTSIEELVYILTRCRLLVAGDSAPLHLACAVGVPVVALFGPTDPAISGPYGGRATVLRKETSCSPCYDLQDAPECRRRNLECMEAITVDEVFAAVRLFLEEPALTVQEIST